MEFDRLNSCLDNPTVMDAYTIYKYTQCPHRPDRDPNEYNNSLCEFSELSFDERVSSLSLMGFDETITTHFAQLDLEFEDAMKEQDNVFLKNMLERAHKHLPTFEELNEGFDKLSTKNQMLLSHLLDIYMNEDMDYPFIEDIELFENRFPGIEESFILRMSLLMAQEWEPTEALLEALSGCWKEEQMKPDGIRIKIIEEDEDDIPQDQHGEHNIAFIGERDDEEENDVQDYMEDTEDEEYYID